MERSCISEHEASWGEETIVLAKLKARTPVRLGVVVAEVGSSIDDSAKGCKMIREFASEKGRRGAYRRKRFREGDLIRGIKCKNRSYDVENERGQAAADTSKKKTRVVIRGTKCPNMEPNVFLNGLENARMKARPVLLSIPAPVLLWKDDLVRSHLRSLHRASGN